MKHLIYVIALLLTFIIPARATCAVTVPVGTIELVYCSSTSVTTASPSAAISDAVAAQFVTWAKAYFTQTTTLGAFNAWFNQYVVAATTANMQMFQTVPPAAPAITPNQ